MKILQKIRSYFVRIEKISQENKEYKYDHEKFMNELPEMYSNIIKPTQPPPPPPRHWPPTTQSPPNLNGVDKFTRMESKIFNIYDWLQESNIVMSLDWNHNVQIIKNRYGTTTYIEPVLCQRIINQLISGAILQSKSEQLIFFKDAIEQEITEKIQEVVEKYKIEKT